MKNFQVDKRVIVPHFVALGIDRVCDDENLLLRIEVPRKDLPMHSIFIYVEDGNYQNRGELSLRHRHEGTELKQDYARDTLRNLQRIWTRPVLLETVVNDQPTIISFDGNEYKHRKM